MVEAAAGKLRDALASQADSGGDKIGVKTGLRAMGNDFRQVAPRRRFAAREMDMQNAKRRGIGKYALPNFRANFSLPRVKSERVGTISAAERAAVREFGEQPGRPFN